MRSRPECGGTLTTVGYDFCGLSVEGNRLVERRAANPDEFAREMQQWAEQITSYLRDEERKRALSKTSLDEVRALRQVYGARLR